MGTLGHIGILEHIGTLEQIGKTWIHWDTQTCWDTLQHLDNFGILGHTLDHIGTLGTHWSIITSESPANIFGQKLCKYFWSKMVQLFLSKIIQIFFILIYLNIFDLFIAI